MPLNWPSARGVVGPAAVVLCTLLSLGVMTKAREAKYTAGFGPRAVATEEQVLGPEQAVAEWKARLRDAQGASDEYEMKPVISGPRGLHDK